MFAFVPIDRVLKRTATFFIALVIVGLVGCSDDESEGTVDFDRAALLENIGSNIILPAFNEFQTQAGNLNTAITTLTEEVSQENLDAAQAAWLSTATTWKRTEMFDLGPIDQLNVAFDIQNFPVNIIGVEDEIDSDVEFTQVYVESLASNRKGISTIEYLLFNFQEGDTEILDLLSTSEERKAYLNALSQNLVTIATDINEGWQASGGNFVNTFVGSTGTSAASSLNTLANEMIILTEEVKNLKLGVPIGKRSMEVLLPDNVEARFSGFSKELILANLASIEQVFKGEGTAGDQLGYADYLDAVNAQFEGEALSSAILTEISQLRSDISNIEDPLQVAVESDFDDAEAAYITSQRIVRLLKTDMINALALTITFTDNDGD